MTEPEQALTQARAAAAALREQGVYGQPPEPGRSAAPAVTLGKLTEWALAEPDLDEVRSTRPWGRPVTALKRGLLRLLAQYHLQQQAHQARFNLSLITQLARLEHRLDELEERLERDRPAP